MQQAPRRHNRETNNNNNGEDNNGNRLIERFLGSINSDKTREGVLTYIHKYMRFWHLYEGESQENNNLIYRYDWLAGAGKEDEEDVQTIQNNMIDFVNHKKKEGMGARGIDNYINHLQKFYKINGVKGIDWEVVKSCIPQYVKQTQDREYTADEVIDIEEKLDVRGKVVSGVMRGSGIRREATRTLSVGDLFPFQTKYGKAYKIIVDRGSSAMYTTACIPEVAKRIDDYFDYRIRFGEVCRQFGKDHKHEYYDGNFDGEVIEKWYKADELHLDPDAPLIREDFDREDSLAARYPRRISDDQITEIVRKAAIAAGRRKVNKGQPFKRHRVMTNHGFRKLFRKRCRKAKMDALIIERFMGHKGGNPQEGVTNLMMTYDPEDWAEMQSEFEKAIPELTITKEAMIQTQLEETKTKLKNITTTDDREQIKDELEQMRQVNLHTAEEVQQLREFLNQARAQLLRMPPYEEGTQMAAKILIKDRLRLEEEIKKKKSSSLMQKSQQVVE